MIYMNLLLDTDLDMNIIVSIVKQNLHENLVNVVCERPPSKVKQRLHHHKIFAVLLQQHKSQCIFHYDVDGKILWKLACQNSLGSKVGVLGVESLQPFHARHFQVHFKQTYFILFLMRKNKCFDTFIFIETSLIIGLSE